MPAGCIVGIDPGERWLGVARAPSGSRTALPVGTIDLGQSADEGRTELAAMLAGSTIATVVVGVPVRPDGAEDDQAARFRAQGERLAAFLGVPCQGQPERDSSATIPPRERPRSDKTRRPGAKSSRRRSRERQRSHADAAARILQRWLDQHPTGR